MGRPGRHPGAALGSLTVDTGIIADMDTAFFRSWIAETARLVEVHAEHLGRLDAAIGDADHGVNLSRGFQAAVEEIENRRPETPGAVLATAGRALISRTGGASGPLYGSALRTAGKALGSAGEIGPAELGAALAEALAAVRQLGGAAEGDKTMVDAICPAISGYSGALAGGADFVTASRTAAQAARQGAEKTIPLQARKGRASYLGPRSVGHEDPGAASAALLFQALHLVAEGIGT